MKEGKKRRRNYGAMVRKRRAVSPPSCSRWRSCCKGETGERGREGGVAASAVGLFVRDTRGVYRGKARPCLLWDVKAPAKREPEADQ